VQSNVGKYCEFKLVSRLLLENNGQLDNVEKEKDFHSAEKLFLLGS
jgi:hypothetical protein